jgi:hypothetical protein
MNWSLAGQIMTAWGIVALIAAPLVGSYLRKRRAATELRSLLGKPYIGVDMDADARRARLTERLRVVQSQLDAATPITQSQWQERARRAEALGFMDSNTEIDSKRAS